MECVVHGKPEYVVLQIQPVLLAIVVRKEIQVREVGLVVWNGD